MSQIKTHSKTFVNQWKKLLQEHFGYEEYMDFLVVRTILGKRILSYMPLLNYTDRLHQSIDDLLELSRDNNFSIRTLSEAQIFNVNEPVTMRLNIREKSFDELMQSSIVSKCRNQIRKSKKSDLDIQIGIKSNLIDDFYKLFSEAMHNYGTPVFSKSFFEKLHKYIETKYLVVYKDTKPVAALIMIYDESLAWIPWAASSKKYSQYCPNHFLYMNAIMLSVEDGKEIFDFGRSSYGGHTYKFKSQWGAKPVAIKIVSSSTTDLYSKYEFASKIWKKLPRSVVNIIGPKLVKYLEDL